MGSIEVFDFKNRKWMPYVPNFEKWNQHFIDIHEGRVKPDYKGRYIVGSGNVRKREKSMSPGKVQVKLVTPVAQALEMAKSELAREDVHKRASEPTIYSKNKSQNNAGKSKKAEKRPRVANESKKVSKSKVSRPKDQLSGK